MTITVTPATTRTTHSLLSPVTLDDVRRVHRHAAERIAQLPVTDPALNRLANALVETLVPLGAAPSQGVLTPQAPSTVAVRALAYAHRQLGRLRSAPHDVVADVYARTLDLLPQV